MESLPTEIIDIIFSSDVITFQDVCRLSAVSKAFYRIAESNSLWKKKYFQMWPELFYLYGDDEAINFKEEFRTRFKYKHLVAKKLSRLAIEYYRKKYVPKGAFQYLKHIADKHTYGSTLIVHELQNIIKDPDRHSKLSLKYYAEKALRYMLHCKLESVWDILLSKPQNETSLLEGACLVSQWIQPTDNQNTVDHRLHGIAEKVLVKIKTLFPSNPVINNGIQEQNVLSQSLWSPKECREVLFCISSVIFKDLRFRANDSGYPHHKSYFIEQALVRRNSTTSLLVIIYISIAAKLGVQCLPVRLYHSYILKWLEFPEKDENDAYTYIDFVEAGALRPSHEVLHRYGGYGPLIEVATPRQVFFSVAWDLYGFFIYAAGTFSPGVYEVVDLMCVLCSEDAGDKMMLARCIEKSGFSKQNALKMLKISENDDRYVEVVSYLQKKCAYPPSYEPYAMSVLTQDPMPIGPNEPTNPNFRKKKRRHEAPDVKFCVGMIMKHKRQNYRCVIYEWKSYAAGCSPSRSDEMIANKHKQPIYHVMVDDNSIKYVPQDELEIDTTNEPIVNERIGMFFDSFCGNFYVLNTATALEYPDDSQARENICEIDGYLIEAFEELPMCF